MEGRNPSRAATAHATGAKPDGALRAQHARTQAPAGAEAVAEGKDSAIIDAMKKASSDHAVSDAFRIRYERMLALMQAPGAKSAMRAAFGAAPAVLGRVAVKAARKSR